MSRAAVLPVLSLAAAALLSGCGAAALLGRGEGGTLTTPIEGVLSDGTRVEGINSVDLGTGLGSFAVSVSRGGTARDCTGSYDATLPATELVIPVDCTDGITGTARVERDETLMSGVASVRLSDGTEGQFVFGETEFDAVFGDEDDADDI